MQEAVKDKYGRFDIKAYEASQARHTWTYNRDILHSDGRTPFERRRCRT